MNMRKLIQVVIFLLICVGIAFIPNLATADDITLKWDANTEPDLGGYKLYYKLDTSGSPYNGVGSPITLQTTNPAGANYIDPNNINPDFSLTLPDGWYFMALTAYDTEIPVNESGFSNEVTTRAILTLATSGDGIGSITANPLGNPPGIYRLNEIVTLLAVSDVESKFIGWEGAVTGTNNPITVTMGSNQNVTAVFSKYIYYSLVVHTAGSGSVNPASGSYKEGSLVPVTATPDSGWEFKEWLDGNGISIGSSPTIDITINSDTVITAVFRYPGLAAPQGLSITVAP
jgi:hypothetical protein